MGFRERDPGHEIKRETSGQNTIHLAPRFPAEELIVPKEIAVSF
jgi:hypothetical protein